MEYNRSAEYTELPDEFNRNVREAPAAEARARKIGLSFLTAFTALLLLVFPVTISSHHSHSHPIPYPPDGPIDPDPPIINPVDEEYEIVGLWENGDLVYNFLENGTGYLFTGQYFNELTWEKTGNDYLVEVWGVNSIQGSNIGWWHNSFTTIKTADGVYMMGLEDKLTSQTVFTPRTSPVNDEKILPLLGKTLSEKLIGFWETQSYVFDEKDNIYNFLSYINIQPDRAVFDFATTHTNQGCGHFEKPWQLDEKDPEVIATVGDDTDMEITIQVTSNNTHNYIGNKLTLFYVLTEEGEMLFTQGLSNTNYMYKMDWE